MNNLEDLIQNPDYVREQYGPTQDTFILQALPGGTAVSSISTGTGLTGGPVFSAGTISLANTTVTPGSYTSANITVDAQGRITAASNGSGSSGTVGFANNFLLMGA